jgi:hypothetical protein
MILRPSYVHLTFNLRLRQYIERRKQGQKVTLGNMEMQQQEGCKYSADKLWTSLLQYPFPKRYCYTNIFMQFASLPQVR